MEEVAQQSSPHTGCPRCGYDLSGEVQRWCDHCPLEGVCSECGLNIRWGGLLGVDARRPEAFFETSRAKPRRAFLETLSRAKNPFRFWNWVKMEYEFNWKRMVLLSIGGMFALHLAYILITVLLSIAVYHLATLPGSPFPNPALNVIETVTYASRVVGMPFVHVYRGWYSGSAIVGSSLWMLVGTTTIIAMPAAFLPLTTTLSNAKVRTVHLVRVMCYSLIWLPFIWLLFTGPTVFNSLMDDHQWNLGRIPLSGMITRPSTSWEAMFTYLMESKETLLDRYANCENALAIVVVFGWNVLWWWCAGKYYLKIPRPFLISITLMILSTLAVLVLSLPVLGFEALRRLFPS